MWKGKNIPEVLEVVTALGLVSQAGNPCTSPREPLLACSLPAISHAGGKEGKAEQNQILVPSQKCSMLGSLKVDLPRLVISGDCLNLNT